MRASLRRMDPLRLDLLIAGAFLVEAELEVLLLVGDVPNAGLAALGMVLLAASIAVRRRSPLGAVALVMIALVAFQPLGRPVNDNVYSPFFVVIFILFSFGLHEEDGRRVIGAVVTALALSIVATLIDDYETGAIDLVFGAVVIAGGPILLGRVISHRTRLNAALREKAERLRRGRAAQAGQAAAQERNRIAGELHDVVTHAMSAMVVQAGGARRLAAKDPERARDAFGAVETTGREALAEIRRLLGVLRHEDEEIGLAPQPSLRHVAALVQRSRAAGLPVELTVDGEERPLPPGVDLTAYRLVQEALSGALAPGAAGLAQVNVRYRGDGIDVEVLDDGAGDGARPLAGVRERVSLYGGRVQSGRRRSGGHAVRAQLPVGGAP